MPLENRTARLTILLDPDKKAAFEEVCYLEDLTPSQVLRRLIRNYLEEKLGRPWKPGKETADRSKPQKQPAGVLRAAKTRRREARAK